MARLAVLLCFALGVLGPATAYAGSRPYVVGYDTPMLADGDVEIETWLDLVRGLDPPADPDLVADPYADVRKSEWRYWFGPRWAPADGVEVAALSSWVQPLNTAAGTSVTEFWAELLEARWKVLDHKPLGTAVVQLNFRIPMANDLPYQLSPSVNWMTRAGRLRLSAQGGYARGWGAAVSPIAGEPNAKYSNYHWIVWNGGAALDVVRGEVSPFIQLGVEGFGQRVLQGQNDFNGQKSTANIGPTFAVAKGRLWLTAGALMRATADSPPVFVRGVIGIAL